MLNLSVFFSLVRLEKNQRIIGILANKGIPLEVSFFLASYDANGNILTYQKKDHIPTLFDNLSYNYNLLTNKLNHVTDSESAGYSSTDVDNQSANNYNYDAIGNLVSDASENISSITWNARGKVKTIDKSTGSDLVFEYDGFGHRIMKRVKEATSQNDWIDSWYVLDPNGNAVAIYRDEYTNLTTNNYRHEFYRQEQHVYGAERLGLINKDMKLFKQDISSTSFNVDGTFNSPSVVQNYTLTDDSYQVNSRYLEVKNYELTNHLGNVMEVISAYKKPVVSSGLTIDYYKPSVLSYSDYYSFGSLLPDRYTISGSYRYGFQNQECDQEIKGNGNSINFEYRMHDPRLGRFLSIDPLAAEYPFNSPYAFSENNVIAFIELEGLEKAPHKYNMGEASPTINLDNQKYSTVAPPSQTTSMEQIQKEGKEIMDSEFRLYMQGVVKSSIRNPDLGNPLVNFGASIGVSMLEDFHILRTGVDFFNEKSSRGWAATRTFMSVLPFTRIGSAAAGRIGSYFSRFNSSGSRFSLTLESSIPLAEGGYSTIYRAVSQGEVDDIAEFGFRMQSGGYETGKLFAPTLEEATQFGKYNFGLDGIPNTIMKVKVPNSVLNNATKFGADGMNAISIPANQLYQLKGIPLNHSPLIR